jgi:hypothetical protein
LRRLTPVFWSLANRLTGLLEASFTGKSEGDALCPSTPEAHPLPVVFPTVRGR